MKQEYLDKIKSNNEWFFNGDKMALVVTDDADSILSALMLMYYFPWKFEIGYFYDFHDGLYQKLGIDENLPLVGVDLSHPNICCISNHLTKTSRNDQININDINVNILDDNNAIDYFSKYNLNTLLLVSSLCGHNFTGDIGKVVAMLPDSAYIPRFQPPSYQDRGVQEKYLNILGYGDFVAILDKFNKEKFVAGQEALNIKSKVWVTENGIEFKEDVNLKVICKYLEIDYDPSLLEGLFYFVENHESKVGVLRTYDKSDMFSFAVTRRNQVKYSYKIN